MDYYLRVPDGIRAAPVHARWVLSRIAQLSRRSFVWLGAASWPLVGYQWPHLYAKEGGIAFIENCLQANGAYAGELACANLLRGGRRPIITILS